MFDKRKYVVIFLFIVSFIIRDCNGCNSLHNVTLIAHQRYGDPFNITSFSGCIERRAFGNKSLTEISIRNQNVVNITKDTIRHMVRLKTVVFWGCPIESISEGAFRNVPLLQNVQISYGKLTAIPDGVFDILPTLKLLRLNDNKLSSIGENAFSDLPVLERIYMANNKLKVWKRSWFKNTTNVEIMDFQKNEIGKIPRFAFKGMTQLKKLFFDFNEIKLIDNEAFKDIRHLEYLGLRYNKIKSLDANIFPNELSVESFFIDANYLNFLSKETLKNVSVKEMTLDGNPWKCPCLNEIQSWLYSLNSTLKNSDSCNGSDIPVCLFPVSNTNVCAENVDEEITRLYKEKLRKFKQLNKFCARID